MPNLTSAINRLPLGLLGFLGIKNGGQYPRDLSPLLSPVWNLSDLYLNANAENSAPVVSVASLGYTGFATVPTGESWCILLASAATGTLGAGVTIEMTLGMTDAAVLTTIALAPMPGSRTVGGRFAVNLASPIWLAPGSSFGVVCTQLAAGPVSTTLAFRFARFTL